MKKLIILTAILISASTTLHSQPKPSGNPVDNTSSVDVSVPLGTDSLLLVALGAGYYGFRLLRDKRTKKLDSDNE
ncbi:MAG: hypothetical protein LBR17_09790 [Bacteroidales bacterium]|jgi:hypothetical protein|nr:hypothetical protein [Bacteroidales bacterium]